jgi:hypothetical protein
LVVNAWFVSLKNRRRRKGSKKNGVAEFVALSSLKSTIVKHLERIHFSINHAAIETPLYILSESEAIKSKK